MTHTVVDNSLIVWLGEWAYDSDLLLGAGESDDNREESFYRLCIEPSIERCLEKYAKIVDRYIKEVENMETGR